MERVYIPLDVTSGQHKNHGFVEFEHKESVPYSILLLNAICLCGRPLRVGTVGKENGLLSAATAMATAAPAVLPSGNATGAPDCTEGTSNTYDEIELQAAVLAAQIQLGMSLPVLSEALLGQAVCPPMTTNLINPPFSSPNDLPDQGLHLPVAAAPTPLFSVSLPTANDTTSQTPPPPPSGAVPLPLFPCTSLPSTNGDVHPTLGQRLSPPPLHPNDPTPLFSCNDEVCPMSPTLPPNGPIPLFGCNPSLWERDCVTNGNLWEGGTPNHNIEDSWKEPPNPDHLWEERLPNKQEQEPDILNSDEIYLSPSPPWNSPSPPRHLTDEHGDSASWEPPPINDTDDIPSSLRFRLSPRHDHTSIRCETEREDYVTPHPDGTMSAEPHPYASDHTHMHRNRVLHIDDKPSWVTNDTKDQIRDHHLSKLSETLACYKQLYSKQGSI